MQKMLSNIVIQMKEQLFNGEESMSVVTFEPEFQRACDASPTHEGAAIWLFSIIYEWSRPYRYQGAVVPVVK